VKEFGMSKGSERQNTEHNGYIDVAGTLVNRIGPRSVINRLGHGKLRPCCGFTFQALDGALPAVGFRVRIENDTGVQAGFTCQPDQLKDIHVAHGGGGRSVTQGNEIAGSDQNRFDSERPGSPQQALQAEKVVIAGRDMQYGRPSSGSLNEVAQGHGAHAWFGNRIGGNAEAVKRQSLQLLQFRENRSGIGPGGGDDLDGRDESVESDGVRHV
jgi:hypothetical protein